MDKQASEPLTGTLSRVRATSSHFAQNEAVTAELPAARPAARVARASAIAGPDPDRQPRSPLALRFVVVFLFILLVAAVAGLWAEHTSPKWFSAFRNVARLPPNTTPKVVRSTTTTTPSVGTSATISSLQPDSGIVGQSVVISGRDIMSTNGIIVAQFGSQVAPTDCPTAQRCVVTVPRPPAGTNSVIVRLQVGSGLSNGLNFRYG